MGASESINNQKDEGHYSEKELAPYPSVRQGRQVLDAMGLRCTIDNRMYEVFALGLSVFALVTTLMVMNSNQDRKRKKRHPPHTMDEPPYGPPFMWFDRHQDNEDEVYVLDPMSEFLTDIQQIAVGGRHRSTQKIGIYISYF